jgi:hypothetical protein
MNTKIGFILRSAAQSKVKMTWTFRCHQSNMFTSELQNVSLLNDFSKLVKVYKSFTANYCFYSII